MAELSESAPTSPARPLIDAHLDLAWNALQWNRDLSLPLAELRAGESHMTDSRARGQATVSLPELRRAGVCVCLGTLLARVKSRVRPQQGFSRRDIDYCSPVIASAVAEGQLEYYRLLERRGQVTIIRSRRDLDRHWSLWNADPATAPVGLIAAMEGADPITTPSQAGVWWQRGVRVVGLAHYGASPYAAGTGADGPLTPAGRALLIAMHELGMILDLTHCADESFFEAIDRFAGPMLASHNTCRKLTPGPRQLSDEQIRRLIERDAVIGVALDAWMIHAGWSFESTPRCAVSLERLIDHIDHICQLAGGCGQVGIGSDLDGGYGFEQCPREIDSIADLHTLSSGLLKRGYSPVDVDAIFYGNWLRFFMQSLPQQEMQS